MLERSTLVYSSLIKRLPKVELHCHLDGSVSLGALRQIAGLGGAPVLEEAPLTEQALKAPAECSNLNDYLRRFSLIMPYLQTREGLEIAAHDVARQAAQERCLHIEMRFSPLYCTQGGLSYKDSVRAALKGCERAYKDYGISSGLILCMMRSKTVEENMALVNLAAEFNGHGVCGIDLAGNEAAHPQPQFRPLFEAAQKAKLNITAHAGECGDAGNVIAAIHMGARRIGHGIAISHSPEAMALCKQQKITLEVCPTSNVQTRAVTAIEAHPFVPLGQSGVQVTLNTDNRTVSDVTLTSEYAAVHSSFPAFNSEAMVETSLNAARAAFLPFDKKRQLQGEIEAAARLL